MSPALLASLLTPNEMHIFSDYDNSILLELC